MRIGCHRRLTGIAGAAALVLTLGGQAAFADAPVETAIKDLATAIGGSADWTAGYRSLSYDAATDTAVISGLQLATRRGDLKVEFETISIVGYAPAAGGGFTAKAIKADGGAVDAGAVKAALVDISFEDVGVPALKGGAFDPEKPFSSMISMYSGVIRSTMGHGHVGSLSLVETIEGITSRVSYENFDISDFHDGKTATVSAGPLKLESPSPDGLVDITIGSVAGSDIDAGAMMRAYDPSTYGPGGIGDMIWHQTLGHAAYKDITMQVPGVQLAIGEFSMDGLKVRQPTHSFAPLLDFAMAHPGMSQQEMADAAREEAVDLLSSIAMGRFAVSGIKVQASGVTQFDLGDVSLSDFSIEGLGEFAIDGLVAAVEGQGAVKIGRFAFGGIKFPDIELLRTASKAGLGSGNTDVPFDPATLAPKLGFLEASGIDIQTTDVPHIGLDRMRVDLGGYVGYLPTRVSSTIVGLDVPLDSLDRSARETFKRLGYDRVSLDYDLKLGWDEPKQQLDIDNIRIRAANVGGMTASAVIGGLTREMVEHPDSPDGAQDLSLVSGKMTLNDESIVGKGLGLLAEKLKVPQDKFRQQFADALPFLLSLSALNDPTLMTMIRQSGLLKKLAPALKTFIAEPSGSLTLTVAPTQPVKLVDVLDAAQKAPENLIGLLNLSFSAEAGKPAPDEKPQAAPNNTSGAAQQ